MFDSQGHYAWWTLPATPEGIRGAHRLLDDHLAARGPYEVLMGFSQGCAVIGSYLLYRAREATPAVPPLSFAAAVFVCGGMPLDALADLGVEVSERARAVDALTSRLMRERVGKLAGYAEGRLDRARPGVGLWDDAEGLVHDPARMPEMGDVFGLDFTAMPRDLRITIPTVHVYGGKDPRWPASLQLAYFCDDRRLYDHGGGHDIPRTTVVSVRIAELLLELEREIQGR